MGYSQSNFQLHDIAVAFYYQLSQAEKCLLNLKTLLRSILPHVPAKKTNILLSEMSTAYHVVCEPQPVGLTMREMTREEIQLYSRCPLQMEDVDLLQSDFYDKVSALQQWLIYIMVDLYSACICTCTLFFSCSMEWQPMLRRCFEPS